MYVLRNGCIIFRVQIAKCSFCFSPVVIQDEQDLDNTEHSGVNQASSEEDERLKSAATIGTALMVVNSYRALIIL
jgi:hypothetical protein